MYSLKGVWSTHLVPLALAAAMVLGAGTFAGGQTVLSVLHATLMETAKTPEISTAELQKILADGSATVFDSRPPAEFVLSHIPGAVNALARPGLVRQEHVSEVAEIERFLGGNKTAAIVLYCNGLYCGASRRTAEELRRAGFTNVRRYQLGIPMWRALGGVTAIELEGVLHVYRNDRTAVYVDARSAEEFKAGSLPGAKHVVAADVRKAKDDGRLPVDHNTRIIVFGKDSLQAQTLAEAIAKGAYHNVAYSVGTFDTLRSVIK